MFWHTIGVQTVFQLKRKRAIAVFYILLFVVLVNYIQNVLTFQGKDIIQMYQPMKLLFLSYNRTNYNGAAYLLLMQLYPLLVVVPAGFLLADEQRSGQKVYMSARLGYRFYLMSELMTVFLVTFIIFTTPFLLEIILNCLAFPLEAAGDMSNRGYYDSSFINGVHQYLFGQFYLISPYLYTVVMTLIFGIVSGVLAVFTAAFSITARIRYDIILFLPVFLLVNLLILIDGGRNGRQDINLFTYITLFNENEKYAFYLPIFLLVLLSLSGIMAFKVAGKDCL